MASAAANRTDKFFHETWIGMVQPSEGLVVSIPVLLDAQCVQRHGPELQQTFLGLCKGGTEKQPVYVSDLPRFLSELLGLSDKYFDNDAALPEALSLYVPEGKQRIAPTSALKRREASEPQREPEPSEAESTPASIAGRAYELLVWDLPQGLPLDKPETLTGPWDYPPSAKFDRLLRQCRVPIGLLHNGECLRLCYAPHGESSGSITFRFADMATVGGRPILDALVMLLHGRRILGAQEGRKLRDLLSESRKRQANVTNELAEQVFDALRLLLDGFEAAAERDGSPLLREALEREGRLGEDNHVYAGLLTVLLRLVFILYAEHRSLLPVDKEHYARHMSLLALFEQLQDDAGAFPDSMHQRYGGWGRLIALFRAVYFGVQHGELRMPARQGDLFDPERFPFLEGWSGAGAPPLGSDERAEIRPPSIDDGTLHAVLEKLLILDGQRLSYQTLDVEQIGSVYEALMGYRVERLGAPAACLRPNKVWVSVDDVREHVTGARGAKWLQETTGLAKAAAASLHQELAAASKQGDSAALAVLEGAALRGTPSARAGKLVLQPGEERRRTSSHYTPRSLSAPIVKTTLDPLIRAMGETPASERILRLVVCDPAMGSGAFLVEACRYLADQVVAAWTRENVLDKIADAHEDVVNHARRLVAQRCLYGVDKNPYAVSLAKLSLWLVTLAKDEPFTFVDHALRHGDSLVGLSFEQITAFHWQPKEQVETCERELREVLDEAVRLRQQIQALAADAGPEAQREKQRLLWDAEDALNRVRLIGDLVVDAFFSADKSKARERERNERLKLVTKWLKQGGPAPEELLAMQAQIRARLPVFHWMIELPEVFWADRPDPLEDDHVNRAAFVDAFIGNPPFLGGRRVRGELGDHYTEWLGTTQGGSLNADVSARFFLRAGSMVGAHGAVGFIATNTIAQGDTRETGLARLLEGGTFVVLHAVRHMQWPGEAAVTVSVVCIARGVVANAHGLKKSLDGFRVEHINSLLQPQPDRPTPTSLRANVDCSFQGCILGPNDWFLLSIEEGDALVSKWSSSSHIVRPFLGGDEVNTDPRQSHERYVIDFREMALNEAKRWPELLRLVETRAQTISSTTREGSRQPWWQFWRARPELRGAISQLTRCLVAGTISKYLIFSFQPTDRIFSHKLYVFPFKHYTQFMVMQSRVHAVWAWLRSSTIRNAGINYSASDCFENFPFPQPDPRTVIPELEATGEQLYTARATYMVDTDQGLTKTYNALKDAACIDPRILELRKLHEQMDAAVLAAYGWSDIEVPPFCIAGEADQQALQRFEDQVLDRLFALNAQRAAEEAAAASATNAPAAKGSAQKRKGRPRGESGDEDAGQGNLDL